MSQQITQPPWPHAEALKSLRGTDSVETASRRVKVTRQTWAAWEKGASIPLHDNLRAIVEEWNCPPSLVGYEPPRGWELVPAAWIRDEAAKLDRILNILERRA